MSWVIPKNFEMVLLLTVYSVWSSTFKELSKGYNVSTYVHCSVAPVYDADLSVSTLDLGQNIIENNTGSSIMFYKCQNVILYFIY